METVGIICEYNPFHLGHRKQMQAIRYSFGQDTAVVCLMSGNYVQRGAPAIFDRAVRARAAMLCGANLVLELPVTASLSSAEGFAQAGVSILSRICTRLCFGSETGDEKALLQCANALLEPRFSELLRHFLSTGLSFPAARQRALESMGCSGALVEKPNDILAVEYCKAIFMQNSPLLPFPITRPGGYHDLLPDLENPSATALRALCIQGEDFLPYVPQAAADCFRDAAVHTLEAGERAILYRLRTMTDSEFESLPYGSEGLWRRLMHAARAEGSLEEILARVKTKRYTRSRLDRMVLCAFLGIDRQALDVPAPYVRILGFDDTGRSLLRGKDGLQNLGWQDNSPYAALEGRANALYGLFARGHVPKACEAEAQRLIYLHR